MKFYSFFIILSFFIIIESDGYRILAIFPFNSRSHNNMFEGVTKALARNGHQVDVVTHYEIKNPPKNYKTIINLDGTRTKLVNNYSIEFAHDLKVSIIKLISELYGNELCDLMGLKEMQNLIKNPPKDPSYDILITESFTAQCFIGIGYHFKIPIITVLTTMENVWINSAIGNPNSAAFVPNVFSEMIEISTFWDRLKNVIQIYQSKYEFNKCTEKAQTEAMRKYLSPDMPNVREIERKVSLTFINAFYSFNGVKSKTPGAIDIAGIHVEEIDNKLPSDLQKWMDDSKHGVVYFTLGSMVVIETLPKETLLIFYSAFAKIAPTRILMKIVNKEKLPPGLPNNVRISNWIPQIPVLRHNNTRLFMTHGGLLSTLEALYHGIPMIGFPLFGDQFLNIQLFAKKKMAILLDYKTITEELLNDALNSVLHNSTFRESAKYQSQLFRDRPLTAGQTVNFWVEYIIRNGPNSLRSPAVDLYWWQFELLDVYGFLLLSFVIILFILMKIVKFIFYKILKIFTDDDC